MVSGVRLHKIISWNVNGLRAVAKKGFFDFLYKEQPALFAVQEIKCKKEQLENELLNPVGYKSVFFSAQKAGYSGVAIYIKDSIKFDNIGGLGIKEFDDEGRLIGVELDNYIFFSAYFPNSQEEGKRVNYKVEYCDAVLEYLNSLNKKNKNILISGDYNIAHTAIDLTHPESNKNSPGYLPEERAWMDKFLLNNPYVDTFRLFNKEPKNYTWWSYRTNARERNVGWRIDYHCVNKIMESRIVDSYHNTLVLGSDHCPVTVLVK